MSIFDFLTSERFKTSIGAVSSPAALRRHLLQTKVVSEIRKSLAKGYITEASIERFTNGLMGDFVRGTQFPHELAFAALACALEARHTDFAEEYLLCLAKLTKISELHFAPRVACICALERQKAAKVVKKSFAPAARAQTTATRKTSVRLIETYSEAAVSFSRLPITAACLKRQK
jgi:hypothetical protein